MLGIGVNDSNKLPISYLKALTLTSNRKLQHHVYARTQQCQGTVRERTEQDGEKDMSLTKPRRERTRDGDGDGRAKATSSSSSSSPSSLSFCAVHSGGHKNCNSLAKFSSFLRFYLFYFCFFLSCSVLCANLCKAANKKGKKKQSQLTKPKQGKSSLLLPNGIVCMLSALTQSKRREALSPLLSPLLHSASPLDDGQEGAERKIKRHDKNKK